MKVVEETVKSALIARANELEEPVLLANRRQLGQVGKLKVYSVHSWP